MSTTRFADAVAAVRTAENELLSHSDMERMIDAASTAEIADILASRGRNAPRSHEELLRVIDGELESVWNFLTELTGGGELELLLYRNNFHNLKAALKALIANTEPQRLFIRPTTLNLGELPKIIASKNYEELPAYMREAAADAYDILTRTLDGQLADILLDTAALNAMQTDSEKSDSELLRQYSQLLAAFSDIKTAYRCSLMEKSADFMRMALCGCRELDKEALIRASANGTESLFALLESSPFAEAAEELRQSPALFEKHCDNKLLELTESAAMKSFGIDPVAAYYLSKETEIRNIRIILICKNCGASKETITERMRALYV